MQLKGKRIAVLAEDGYEDLELWYPVYRFREAGADVAILGTGAERYSGKHGYEVAVERAVEAVDPGAFDILLIPGGRAPAKLREHTEVLDFVRKFNEQGRLIAAICHGPQVLASAGVLKQRKLTSYPGIQAELEQAGAEWVDEEVVHEGNLITSRKPDDLPAFCRDIIGANVELGESSVPVDKGVRYY